MRERRRADQTSLWPWDELVRESADWQDLWMLDIWHFLSISGICSLAQQLPLAALHARLDEWGTMATPSNQVHQFVKYFDLTHGLIVRQFYFRLENLMLQRHQLPYAKSQCWRHRARGVIDGPLNIDTKNGQNGLGK